MHKLRSLPSATRAKGLIRLSTRLKSNERRPSAPLGSRILTNQGDIFQHNMWDHVQWTDEDKKNAQKKAEENSRVKIPLTEQGKFDTAASQYWDRFYEVHQDKFFKDRKWLFLEFPELLPPDPKPRVKNRCQDDDQAEHDYNAHPHKDSSPLSSQDGAPEAALETNEAFSFLGQHAAYRILEVGCGVGNSVFPIVNQIKGKGTFLYCCDFSLFAIQLLKNHPDYNDSVCHAFVHDLCEEQASFPFPPRSLDVILAVFVLSSIHPERLQGVVDKLSTYLKQGGVFLFRDYGRYDFSQLRFKSGRCLSENFYTRGDGTCVYFFTKDEVRGLFSRAGLEEVQNLEDRRLQVNRGKKVVMHRVWIQSKYKKS